MKTMVYDIRARHEDIDGTISLFTWRRDPETGIVQAKRDAVTFGRSGLYDFHAVKIAAVGPGEILVN